MGIFKEIGLSEKELKVYLFLAKSGPCKARDISQSLELERVQLYRMLKHLQNRGMIESFFEHPTRFKAISFTKIMDRLIKEKKDEAKFLESHKNKVMSQLKKLRVEKNEKISEKFIVLEGRKIIYSKARELIQNATKSIVVVSSGLGVIQAYVGGLLEAGFSHHLRDKISWNFLTSLPTEKDRIELTFEVLKRAESANMVVKANIVDFIPNIFPRFIIKDFEELIFFLRPNEKMNSNPKNETGFWTDNLILVQAFKGYYEEMRRNSTPIQEKIKEIFLR